MVAMGKGSDANLIDSDDVCGNSIPEESKNVGRDFMGYRSLLLVV